MFLCLTSSKNEKQRQACKGFWYHNAARCGVRSLLAGKSAGPAVCVAVPSFLQLARLPKQQRNENDWLSLLLQRRGRTRRWWRYQLWRKTLAMLRREFQLSKEHTNYESLRLWLFLRRYFPFVACVRALHQPELRNISAEP